LQLARAWHKRDATTELRKSAAMKRFKVVWDQFRYLQFVKLYNKEGLMSVDENLVTLVLKIKAAHFIHGLAPTTAHVLVCITELL
jgi:hypothetical protein